MSVRLPLPLRFLPGSCFGGSDAAAAKATSRRPSHVAPRTRGLVAVYKPVGLPYFAQSQLDAVHDGGDLLAIHRPPSSVNTTTRTISDSHDSPLARLAAAQPALDDTSDSLLGRAADLLGPGSTPYLALPLPPPAMLHTRNTPYTSSRLNRGSTLSSAMTGLPACRARREVDGRHDAVHRGEEDDVLSPAMVNAMTARHAGVTLLALSQTDAWMTRNADRLGLVHMTFRVVCALPAGVAAAVRRGWACAHGRDAVWTQDDDSTREQQQENSAERVSVQHGLQQHKYGDEPHTIQSESRRRLERDTHGSVDMRDCRDTDRTTSADKGGSREHTVQARCASMRGGAESVLCVSAAPFRNPHVRDYLRRRQRATHRAAAEGLPLLYPSPSLWRPSRRPGVVLPHHPLLGGDGFVDVGRRLLRRRGWVEAYVSHAADDSAAAHRLRLGDLFLPSQAHSPAACRETSASASSSSIVSAGHANNDSPNHVNHSHADKPHPWLPARRRLRVTAPPSSSSSTPDAAKAHASSSLSRSPGRRVAFGFRLCRVLLAGAGDESQSVAEYEVAGWGLTAEEVCCIFAAAHLPVRNDWVHNVTEARAVAAALPSESPRRWAHLPLAMQHRLRRGNPEELLLQPLWRESLSCADEVALTALHTRCLDESGNHDRNRDTISIPSVGHDGSRNRNNEVDVHSDDERVGHAASDVRKRDTDHSRGFAPTLPVPEDWLTRLARATARIHARRHTSNNDNNNPLLRCTQSATSTSCAPKETYHSASIGESVPWRWAWGMGVRCVAIAAPDTLYAPNVTVMQRLVEHVRWGGSGTAEWGATAAVASAASTAANARSRVSSSSLSGASCGAEEVSRTSAVPLGKGCTRAAHHDDADADDANDSEGQPAWCRGVAAQLRYRVFGAMCGVGWVHVPSAMMPAPLHDDDTTWCDSAGTEVQSHEATQNRLAVSALLHPPGYCETVFSLAMMGACPADYARMLRETCVPALHEGLYHMWCRTRGINNNNNNNNSSNKNPNYTSNPSCGLSDVSAEQIPSHRCLTMDRITHHSRTSSDDDGAADAMKEESKSEKRTHTHSGTAVADWSRSALQPSFTHSVPYCLRVEEWGDYVCAMCGAAGHTWQCCWTAIASDKTKSSHANDNDSQHARRESPAAVPHAALTRWPLPTHAAEVQQCLRPPLASPRLPAPAKTQPRRDTTYLFARSAVRRRAGGGRCVHCHGRHSVMQCPKLRPAS